MDISSIGTQALSYVPLSSSPGNAKGLKSMEAGGFEEILKRAERSEALPSRPLPKNLPVNKDDRLYELCVELETFLIKNLLKSMRATVQKSNLIDTGFAGGVYEDMLYDEYAKTFAKNASLGFAEMAYRDLSRGGF
jgi:flagellar protein FlgJ